MQRYKKIIYLFLVISLLSAAVLALIFNLKEKEEPALNADRVDIYTQEDYLAFVESVNSGDTYQNREISLQSDLDFSGYDNLVSIGTFGEEDIAFLGVFNGNGHTISGINMDVPGGCAALFTNLGGIVKNLQVKDCVFSGRVCGAVTAYLLEGTVLNCYADTELYGETTGALVGKQLGDLLNCVAASGDFTGEYQEGKTEHCYQSDQMVLEELNQNLVHISGYYEDTDFCCWKEDGLSLEKADLLDTLTAKLNVKGAELDVFGYYSKLKNTWCITSPTAYGNEKIFLEARTSQNAHQGFSSNPKDGIMIFTWEGRYYPIEFLSAENTTSVYITLPEQKGLDFVHANKLEEIPGILTVIDDKGNIEHTKMKGFYGHGNDSWKVAKKGYNLKLESYTDLLGMGANDDYVLIAGYRNESLMSYVAMAELAKEIGFAYAPEFRMVNLYVAGEYVGVYFLVEKIELDKNRIDIDSVYENTKAVNTTKLDNFEFCEWKKTGGVAERYYYDIPNNPKDITGGYLLEADTMDYPVPGSRFVSDRGMKFTLKRAAYSSKEQVDYIADYWQEFEDALYSETGYNQHGKHYTEYIDLESFAMQWLCYELSQDISVNSSIYYYKESDITGDGLLHACFPWDVEHSFVSGRRTDNMWLINFVSSENYWSKIYQQEEFQEEVCNIWQEKFVPAIQKLTASEPMVSESGSKNLAWHQEHLVEMHFLENSRWENMYLWNRCEEIEEFIELRSKALSQYFVLNSGGIANEMY